MLNKLFIFFSNKSNFQLINNMDPNIFNQKYSINLLIFTTQFFPGIENFNNLKLRIK